MYYHAVADWLSAGRYGGPSAFYFHEAEAAGCKRCGGFSYST